MGSGRGANASTGMKILVTGSDGYVGSVLTPLLAAAGHTVTGFDSFWFAPCGLAPHAGPSPRSRGDVRTIAADRLAGFDAVVHLAALCNDPLGDLNPDATAAINHRAVGRLAGLACAAGVPRFVQASSCSLYGAAEDALIDEDAPFNPVSVYGRSKVDAERALGRLVADDFSPVCLRFATAYGVSPRLRGDLVVNNLVGYAVTTGEVLLKSDGSAWRPLVHVEDMARAILAACEAPREAIHGRAFNVGVNDENYRVRDIAECVAAHVAGSRIRYADRRFTDARNYRVDCTRIREALPAFTPAWDLERGVVELADAYREHALTAADLTGPRLDRVQRLRALIEARELGPDLVPRGDGELALGR